MKADEPSGTGVWMEKVPFCIDRAVPGTLTGNVGFWSREMGPTKIKNHMHALPDTDDEKLLGYWPLDEGEGNAARNLKEGASAAVPVGNGFFMWNKGANMPTIEGTHPLVDSGTKIIFR